MKVTVKVTEEMGNPHLRDKGKRVTASCMVAQALRLLIKEENWIEVQHEVAEIGNVAQWAPPVRTVYSFYLPENEQRLIQAYDSGLCVPAHEFEMDVPSKYLREREGK